MVNVCGNIRSVQFENKYPVDVRGEGNGLHLGIFSILSNNC